MPKTGPRLPKRHQIQVDLNHALDQLGIAVAGLRGMAGFDDEEANAYLERTGSYALFDYPGYVKYAREVLAKLDVEILSHPRVSKEQA